MKSNTNIHFSIFMMLTLANHVHGSEKGNAFDDEDEDYGFVSSLTQEEELDLLKQKKLANENLIIAAKNSDISGFKMALGQHADINYQDEDGNTASHYIELNDPTIFGNAIFKGISTLHNADIHIANKDGQTVHDIQINKWDPYLEPIINVVCRPKQLADGSYPTSAEIVTSNDNSVIQAIAERITTDNDEAKQT